jgi:iron complex transport system ATP-binding protein
VASTSPCAIFSLTIGAGEHVAILGPNGCGKSTLIKTITRECYPLAQPGSSVTILGERVWNVVDLRTMLGIVSNDLMAQCTREITGFEIVLSGFFSSIGIWPNHQVTEKQRRKAADVLRFLEAAHLAEKPVDEMSSGEARRMLIGRALVHDPKALLLDEPSTSLDLFAQHELRESIRKLARAGVAILLVTHHLVRYHSRNRPRHHDERRPRNRRRWPEGRSTHRRRAARTIRRQGRTGAARRLLSPVVGI